MIMASWISTIDHPKIPMQEIIHPSSFSPFASSPPTFSSWRRLNGSLPEYCWEGYWMGRGLFPHGFATEEKGTPPPQQARDPWNWIPKENSLFRVTQSFTDAELTPIHTFC